MENNYTRRSKKLKSPEFIQNWYNVLNKAKRFQGAHLCHIPLKYQHKSFSEQIQKSFFPLNKSPLDNLSLNQRQS